MTATVLTPASRTTPAAAAALEAAAKLWFAAAVIGQGLFVFYILAAYGPTTLSGDFAAWNENKQLLKGYVPGDTAGNLAFAAHVLMAAVVTFGGTLQLVPQIRARAPAVHRWIGRAFLTTAILASVVGLYMTWGRPTGDSLPNAIAISLDAVLILTFAGLAWRTAMARDFVHHRRWAMRTFVVANGVWFLRLGIVAYGILRKPFGDAAPSMGTFFDIWNFGCYLVPLAILELYFLAKAGGGPRGRLAMAGGLVVATGLMSLGIAGSWFGMFAPVLAKL
ncbi:MAG: DUF2306 domain-containing protein [Phenylobacterium sp.]|uniref:DUF2306 domain-containing protein n=1 Tax=Phenylobacterium sp. TaxID=1871053 RepID=UPI0027371808|nr:DUF2306 domain-containing protein [Phenylobacterium sp.]MDP3746131.1 DUF2306 domain-containing protein [Phenylobacterium sp.]